MANIELAAELEGVDWSTEGLQQSGVACADRPGSRFTICDGVLQTHTAAEAVTSSQMQQLQIAADFIFSAELIFSNLELLEDYSYWTLSAEALTQCSIADPNCRMCTLRRLHQHKWCQW